MTPATAEPARNDSIGHWLVACVLPLLLVAGCTRPTEPGDPTSNTDAVTTDSRSDPSVPDTVATDADNSVGTTTDNDPGDSTSATTDSDDEPTTDSTSAGTDDDQIEPDRDGDSATRDPAAITVAAIMGAGLVLTIAALWMVRMNRSDDTDAAEPVDESR